VGGIPTCQKLGGVAISSTLFPHQYNSFPNLEKNFFIGGIVTQAITHKDLLTPCSSVIQECEKSFWYIQKKCFIFGGGWGCGIREHSPQ